jgi:HlyD family secretion protein
MRSLLKWLLILLILGGGAGLAWPYAWQWWKARNTPEVFQSAAERGDIISVVNATGTVNPVLSIRVGSFVSGPVVKLHVDFNSRVKQQGLLAEIDPQIYEAVKARDEATLAVAEAEIGRTQAQLQQAVNDEKRAIGLREKNHDYLSDSEMDKLRFARMGLEAQLRLAQAQARQAQANLQNSLTNLGYTKIRSPVDGVVLDRKIDEGQTLVAQFQVPDLFVVAPDLEKEIHVYASIDEADVGLIRKAQREQQPVFFTVDAYPDDLFEGRIFQLRMNPTTKENVVTYTVVVTTSNPELKLLPGMTAQLSFQVEQKQGVLKVPNAALRFYPQVALVRAEDRKLLEAAQEEDLESSGGDETTDARSAIQRTLDRQSGNRHHVWIWEHDQLRAVEVTTGLNDYRFTEVRAGPLAAGQKVVTLIK